ncbi:protein BOLA4, chloroplastic/mitochondrial-like [Melia azedarach]|uniref:Protein BOLA4, chloroplastic/mitochondrial-like n=1 Tax=Melia azedarach TaxID=155640 RepID=A0ACC1YC11_MELAZ|nr:protein BOLA4, chloroplastic/mitochondrial-like [Melia azedarach]
MAKTLMSRPYIFSSSSKTFSCLFLQPKRPFVSQTTVLLTRSKSRMSSSFKLPIRSDRQLATNSRLGDVVHRRFTTRATHVNDAGSIDSPLMQSMENKIKEHLNAESVSVKDAYGDGRHVSIDVIASAFEGQSAVNRQRMVYKAIWEELQSTVHAVDQMTTKTPAEAEGQK